MRFATALLITLGLIFALMTWACLPGLGASAAPPAAVVYVPLVRNLHPTPTPVVEGYDRPKLLSPGPGSQLSTLAPELVWRSVGEHWYTVQVSTDPQFSVTTLSLPPSTYCGGPEYKTALLINLEPVTLYRWRVGYDDNTGVYTWSQAGWFTTPGPGRDLPPAPVLAAPADGELVGSLSPYLVWRPVAGARMYHITLGVHENMFTFSVLAPDASQSVPFTLLPGRTYAWHVRAFNGYGWGPESSTWLFRAPRP